MIPKRRFSDRYPIDRPFVAAIIMAVAVVLPDWRSLTAWATALGIISAAISSGVHKKRQLPDPPKKYYAGVTPHI